MKLPIKKQLLKKITNQAFVLKLIVDKQILEDEICQLS